jgi:hypothetical protein
MNTIKGQTHDEESKFSREVFSAHSIAQNCSNIVKLKISLMKGNYIQERCADASINASFFNSWMTLTAAA